MSKWLSPVTLQWSRYDLSLPRGPSSANTLVSLPSSSINLAAPAGRAIALYYICYAVPVFWRRFKIVSIELACGNRRMAGDGSDTENVFEPRIAFQLHGGHSTRRSPSTVLDASYTPQIFGANGLVTTGATSATQALGAEAAHLLAGDVVRFIKVGSADLFGTVLTPHATAPTFTASLTTTTGLVWCKHLAPSSETPTNSNTNNLLFSLTSPIKVERPPACGRMWLAAAIEHATTHATYTETAMTAEALPFDILRSKTAGGTYLNQDPFWSGTSLGTDMRALAFPADPEAGTNLTQNSGGASANHLNFVLNIQELLG